MYRKLRERWLSLSIAGKTRINLWFLLLVIAVTAGFAAYVLRVSYSVGHILSDIARCESLQDAMSAETAAFRIYVRSGSEAAQEALRAACEQTSQQLEELPYDYTAIGPERYARTWNIRSAYQYYSGARSRIAAATDRDQSEIDALYDVYEMQGHIEGYLRTLTQLTVDQGTAQFGLRLPALQRAPYLLAVFSVCMLLISISFSRSLVRSLVTPVEQLAASARRMEQNDLTSEDVVTDNRDELGELVHVFNRMKHATAQHIETLHENQMLEERLHREELVRAQMEKNLEDARLSLLQSQIKPHFLFNTLNTISGMAQLEDAQTTDQMIRSLSNIFRYNLATTEQFVSLKQELNVLQDYMYLQQMRFGDRIVYRVEIAEEIDTESVLVPVFVLQPLAENAISHGIAKKEQGGLLLVRVAPGSVPGKDGAPVACVMITVEDSGAGMSPQRLEEVRAGLKTGIDSRSAGPDHENSGDANEDSGDTHEDSGDVRHTHIGLANVSRRIHEIYEYGDLFIESIEGKGTVIILTIPQLNHKEG